MLDVGHIVTIVRHKKMSIAKQLRERELMVVKLSNPIRLLTMAGMIAATGTIWLVANSVRAQSTLALALQDGCSAIERSVPPLGMEIPSEQQATWLKRLEDLERRLAARSHDNRWADVAILTKACRYAIEFRELYVDRDFKKLDRALDLASSRLAELEQGPSTNWLVGKGLQVRGFKSKVDGSPQPVGMIVPQAAIGSGKKLPLFVWLHGRGDKATDLHFINDRLDKKGEVAPENAIVIHPLGRQCLGYKSAGETDVLEAIEFACQHYPIDVDRVVLMGFSMGGAGVWHLAAHYADRFIAASPGAGFAETARYQNLTPDIYPPKYEQILWSVYDVPGYVRNLFNLPVIAYSGELDKQIQAARIMEEAFQQEGRVLPHMIGPGMGHKYHPDTLKELLARMNSLANVDEQPPVKELFLQTRHWRYATRRWIQVDGIQQQYADTRVDATQTHPSQWKLQTKNVSRIVLGRPTDNSGATEFTVDGNVFRLDASAVGSLRLEQADGRWTQAKGWDELRKRPGMSGPIDDAFIDPFLVVIPTGTSASPAIDKWVKCELRNFVDRWRSLFRGDPRIKRDVDVTSDDLQSYHVVAWGDPSSNRVLARACSLESSKYMPLVWSKQSLQIGGNSFDVQECVPVMVYPNPLSAGRERYLVINSGPTFRQAHDRTNSLQNPHLPDWAIVSTAQAPSSQSPGKLVKAGFFDDHWLAQPELTY